MARIVGCIFGLCLLLAAPARAATTPDDARATLDRAIKALPDGWSVRYADLVQTADGALVMKDLVLSHDGRLMLAAASVTVSGLRGDGSAASPFAADRLEATALGDSDPSGATAADRLQATGIAFGAGEASGLPPGSQAAAIVQALTAVRVDHAELGPVHGKDGAIGRITLDHLAQGRTAAAVMADAAFDEPADSQRVTVAAIEADDVDIARLVRVFDPSAYSQASAEAAPPLPIGPAVGRFAVHGFAVKKAGDTTRLDAVELTELRLGQAPAAPAGATPAGKWWATVPAALGAAVIGGVHYQPAGNTETGFAIGSIALTNYSDGRFDALRFGATTFTEADKHIAFGLQSAVLRGFDANRLLAWAAADAGQPASGQPASDPPPPRLAGFELNGLFVDSPSGDRVTLASLSDVLEYHDETPVAQDLRLRGLAVPAHALAGLLPPPVLAAFGRDSVAADLDFRLAWNPQTHDLALAPFQIAAEGLGRLTLTMTLGNIDLSLLSHGAGPALAGLVVATIKDGELVYADASLLDRALAAYAAGTGQTAPQLRQLLVAQLTKMKSPLPSRPSLPAQLAAFVQHPSSLSVRITPAAPLPAAMVAALTPDETARKLDLSMTVK